MTIQGALTELNNLLNADDVPLYYKGSIKKVIETIKQEPKTGHWIFDKERLGYWISTCSECKHIFHGNEVLIYKPKFCANCGTKMVEPQESEEI